MKAQEKHAKWREFMRAVPFLKVGRLSITYKDHRVLDYIPNLFYGKVFYGPWHIGGPSAFYTITLATKGVRHSTLDFKDDYYPPTYIPYYTTEELEARTASFWRGLQDVARYIRRLAWPPQGLQDVRMWLGVTAWMKGWRIPDFILKIDRLLASMEGRKGGD
jgi:hypothetical protein